MTRQPKYRRHSTRDKAFVQIDGRRVYLPGKYDSSESRAAYRDHLARLKVKTVALPDVTPETATLGHLATAYLIHTLERFGDDARSPHHDYRRACRWVVGSLGLHSLPAKDFGPRHLKQLQRHLVEAGLARETVNGVCVKVRTWIRWAVSEELCPPAVLAAVSTVRGLERGRGDAHDPPPREPARWEDVQPALRFLQPTVRDMVWLQWYSGARSRSICEAKPEQFGTLNPNVPNILLWRPRHKTERRREVVLPLGPRCQAHLRPWLDRDPDAYCFSPQEARGGSNPRKRPAYSPDSYRQSISRAIEQAQKRAKSRGEYVPQRWTPHQLRHARGTIVRDKYGVESAAAVLGHASVDVTELYTLRAIEAAARAAAEIG